MFGYGAMKKLHIVWWLCMVPSFSSMAALLFEYGFQHAETRLLVYAMACPLIGIAVGTLIVALNQNAEEQKNAELAQKSVEHSNESLENSKEAVEQTSESLVLQDETSAPLQTQMLSSEQDQEQERSVELISKQEQEFSAQASEVLGLFESLSNAACNKESEAETISMAPDGPPIEMSGKPNNEEGASRYLAVPVGLPFTSTSASKVEPKTSRPALRQDGAYRYAKLTESQETSYPAKSESKADNVKSSPAKSTQSNLVEAVLPDLKGIDEWFDYAQQLMDSENFNTAILCYDKITRQEPSNLDAWFLKAMAYRGKGQSTDALYCLNYCLQLKAENPVVLAEKANCLLEQGKVQQALACFDKSLSIDRVEARPWVGKGRCLALLGKHKEAIFCFEKALVIQPNNEEAQKAKSMSTTQAG